MHRTQLHRQPHERLAASRAAPGTAGHCASRPAVALATALLTVVTLALVGTASAQAPADAPIVGVHFQDLLPSDGDTIEVFLARPHLDEWDGVTLMSSEDCAELGRLGDPGPDHVLVLEVTLSGANGPLAAGETCTTTLVASYHRGAETWSGATLLTVTRLPHPPLAPDAVMATLTVDRISLSNASGAPGTALFLTLTNTTSEPIELVGLANPDGFEAAVGAAYQSEERLGGSLELIQATGHALTPTRLAAAASTNLVLVLDPYSRLPDGSGVITVQPAVLVSVTGVMHSLRFERLSTAWGNELP